MTRKGFPRSPRAPVTAVRRRYATAVMAREVLRDVARVLELRGIRVMPLKGVLLQHLLYADPAERALTDVDVLVPEQDFEHAILALIEAGFQPLSVGKSLVECALRAPRGFTVDLHRQLFGRGRYRLSTDALFRRASRDESLLGVPLYIPDPYDTAAHLIGKFVTDQERFDPLPRLEELAAWAAHCSLDPVQLGCHLCGCGMQRAGHYVLSRGAEMDSDAFFSAALAAFPVGARGKMYTRVARALIPRLQGTKLASLPAHLLNTSLARGAVSLSWVVAGRVCHAWLTRQRGAGGGYWSPFFAPVGNVRSAQRRELASRPTAQRS
ncbi:MAG TPA: nucleotidyltransferase family protein [Polyangiaceae bacterium]|nr:nucleotidyltransferase family protein [Polyangiaceae bacterium]